MIQKLSSGGHSSVAIEQNDDSSDDDSETDMPSSTKEYLQRIVVHHIASLIEKGYISYCHYNNCHSVLYLVN